MDDSFDNDLLRGAQRKVEYVGTINFPEDFYGFAVTVYKTKGHLILPAGCNEKVGLRSPYDRQRWEELAELIGGRGLKVWNFSRIR